MSTNPNSAESNPPPQPDDLPPNWPSVEDFLKWGAEKPDAVRHLEQVARRVELGEFGDLTPELLEAAGRFTAMRRQQAALIAAKAKAVEIMQVIQAPADDFSVKERFQRVKTLFDELSDVLLNVPEPHRTQFFNQIAPLREKLKAIKPEAED